MTQGKFLKLSGLYLCNGALPTSGLLEASVRGCVSDAQHGVRRRNGLSPTNDLTYSSPPLCEGDTVTVWLLRLYITDEETRLGGAKGFVQGPPASLNQTRRPAPGIPARQSGEGDLPGEVKFTDMEGGSSFILALGILWAPMK